MSCCCPDPVLNRRSPFMIQLRKPSKGSGNARIAYQRSILHQHVSLSLSVTIFQPHSDLDCLEQLRFAYRFAQTGLEDVHHLRRLRLHRNLRCVVHHGGNPQNDVGGDRFPFLTRECSKAIYRARQTQEGDRSRRFVGGIAAMCQCTNDWAILSKYRKRSNKECLQIMLL